MHITMLFEKYVLMKNIKYLPDVDPGIIEDSTKKGGVLIRFLVITTNFVV